MKLEGMVSPPGTPLEIWNLLRHPNAGISRGHEGIKPASKDQHEGLIEAKAGLLSRQYSARFSLLDNQSQLLIFTKKLQDPPSFSFRLFLHPLS